MVAEAIDAEVIPILRNVQKRYGDHALDIPLACLTVKIRRDTQRPTHITDAMRWRVWERDNFTCQFCGSRRFLAVDHIYPKSRGGQTVMSNLQTLCRRCNSEKGVRVIL